MEFPGEKLVLRLIETIEKSGTAIFRPWQIKRLAQAEAIAQSDTAYSNFFLERDLSALKKLNVDFTITDKIASDLQLHGLSPALIEYSAKTSLVEQTRRQINIESALAKAESSLQKDAAEPPKEYIDMDWFFRWRDNAGTVSNQLLQEVWGNVLAGEIKSPGTFSLRTLDFLRNLSQAEAKTIESVAPYVINDFALIFGSGFAIGSPESIVTFEIFPNRGHLIQLEELGLLNIGSDFGFRFNESTELPNGYFGWLFRCHGRAVAATSLHKDKRIRLCFYKLTALGKDVFSLVNSSADEAYLNELALYLANEGFESEIMDYVKIEAGIIQPTNIQRVWPSIAPEKKGPGSNFWSRLH